MKKYILKYAKYWIAGAALLTVVFGTIYVVAQQNLRQSANDPQIQLAEDTANALANGTQFSESIPNINIGTSLSPFVIVFDASKKPVLSTGYLGNSVPTPPAGVFDHAKSWGENRITWEPKSGVRIATVVDYYENASSSGYVLAGRSLKESESRAAKIAALVLFGWFVSLAALLFAVIFPVYKKTKNS